MFSLRNFAALVAALFFLFTPLENITKEIGSHENGFLGYNGGLFLLASLTGLTLAQADEYTSGSFKVLDPLIDAGGSTATSSNFSVGQSFSQVAIGKSTSTSFQLWSGFQYFFKVGSNTLTATAGDGQVNLSWTAPTGFLGVSAGAYEVGTGTSSGSYTYESVGNVTSYTKTGLNNGTTYYFKIKAKTASGTFLVFSNETSALPVAGNQQGGGGGGSITASIKLAGQAYPGAQVFLLLNAGIVATANTDTVGNFNLVLSPVNPGKYDFSIYAKDVRGARSALLPIVGSVYFGQQAVIPNIFLPPTATVNAEEVKRGDVFIISGYSQPGSEVNFAFVPAIAENELAARAEASGFYSLEINSGQMEFGSYSLKAKSSLSGFSSIFSDALRFLVGTKFVPSKPPSEFFKKADLNGDGRVDLIDFSILAYWYLRQGFPESVDLNSDARVDLIDFSILAFYWEG